MNNYMRQGIILVALLFMGTSTVAAEEAISRQASPEKDYAEFARKIETTIKTGDPSFLDNHLDMDILIDNAIKNYVVSEKLKSSLRTEIKDKTTAKSVGRFLVDAIHKSIGFRFLCLRKSATEYYAIFRLLPTNFRLDYLYLRLEHTKSGNAQIADFYFVSQQQWKSETIQHYFLTRVSETNEELRGTLQDWEKDFVKNVPKMNKMRELGRKEFLRLYPELPQTLQKEKLLLLSRIQFAHDQDQKIYQESVLTYQQVFPDDPALDLMLLKISSVREYSGNQKNLTSLDYIIGGDPFIHALQAFKYYDDKKFELAKELSRKILEQEQDLVVLSVAYWVLVDISLEEKDYKETAFLLTSIDKNVGFIVLDDIKGSPKYSGFSQSPEYQNWVQSRQKQ